MWLKSNAEDAVKEIDESMTKTARSGICHAVDR